MDKKSDNFLNKPIVSEAISVLMSIGSPIILIFILVVCCQPDPTKKAAKDMEAKQLALVERSRNNVALMLKDPASAKFRNSYFSLALIGGKEIPVTCGEVNAKNSFGAYTGYERFIAPATGISYLESQISNFDTLWKKMCY